MLALHARLDNIAQARQIRTQMEPVRKGGSVLETPQPRLRQKIRLMEASASLANSVRLDQVKHGHAKEDCIAQAMMACQMGNAMPDTIAAKVASRPPQRDRPTGMVSSEIFVRLDTIASLGALPRSLAAKARFQAPWAP